MFSYLMFACFVPWQLRGSPDVITALTKVCYSYNHMYTCKHIHTKVCLHMYDEINQSINQILLHF